MRIPAAAALLLLGVSRSLADGTIDTLTAAAVLVGTESIPIFQTANPAVRTTPNAISTLITGRANTWSALNTFGALTATGTLTTNITGAGTQCVQASAAGVLSGTGSACGAGGGGTPGGANTNVQFNNAGAFGGDAGFTYTGNGQAVLALGTITANNRALSITGTWNNAAVTFDAPLFMNITRTAMNGASRLIDIQVDSATSVFTLSQGGVAAFFSDITSSSGGVTGNAFTFTGNTVIIPEGTGQLGQRFSSAQAYRVYNTFTDTTTYERGALDWVTTANTLTVGTQKGSVGGSVRAMNLVTGGTNAVTISTAQLVALPAITTDSGQTATSTVCQDTTTHALYFGSGTAGICKGTSSARFKDDIETIPSVLNRVMGLRPVSFVYRPGYGDNGERRQYGLIAEEVDSIFPEMVARDADGSPVSVDYGALWPILVRAVQQLQAEIDELRKGR